jgi:hypothetical protein
VEGRVATATGVGVVGVGAGAGSTAVGGAVRRVAHRLWMPVLSPSSSPGRVGESSSPVGRQVFSTSEERVGDSMVVCVVCGSVGWTAVGLAGESSARGCSANQVVDVPNTEGPS